MFLFGKKNKKKSNKNATIRTPYGYIPEFTTVDELPDDLNTLRAMGYYYTYNSTAKNRETVYYVDKKIIGLDDKKQYSDSRYRMAKCYFDGFMVQQDYETGSRYFIEYMDYSLMNSRLSSMAIYVKNYFDHGFRDYNYLIEMALRRIKQDIQNKEAPVGMAMYENFIELWKYSALVPILGIENSNATYYFEFLKNNFDIPAAELMLEIIKYNSKEPLHTYQDNEAYSIIVSLAEKGNLWAMDFLTDTWLNNLTEKNPQQEAQTSHYKNEYTRLTEELKNKQRNLSHQANILLKEEMDATLNKYADFFMGKECYIPQDYPFPKKESSIYYRMSRFLHAYNELNELHKTGKTRLVPQTPELVETVKKYGHSLIKDDYAPAMFLMLLTTVNKLITVNTVKDSDIQRIYNRLIAKDYGPALKIQTMVDDDTRELALKLKVNKTVMDEEAAKYLIKAISYAAHNKWTDALINLKYVAEYDGNISESLKKDVISHAVSDAITAYERTDKSFDYELVFHIAADSFCEPVASYWLAIIENNDNEAPFSAYKYLQNTLAWAEYSYYFDGPIHEAMYDSAKSNLDIARFNSI